MTQAVVTTEEKCSHQNADSATPGIVADCRNRLWRTNCLQVTRLGDSSGDSLCVWNNYHFPAGTKTVDNTDLDDAAWNRMPGRKLSYGGQAAAATPTATSAAECAFACIEHRHVTGCQSFNWDASS